MAYVLEVGKLGRAMEIFLAVLTATGRRRRRPSGRQRPSVRDDPEAVPGVPVGELPVAWTLLVLGCVAGALLAGEFDRLTLRIAAPFLLVGGLLALASLRAVGRGATLATRRRAAGCGTPTSWASSS